MSISKLTDKPRLARFAGAGASVSLAACGVPAERLAER